MVRHICLVVVTAGLLGACAAMAPPPVERLARSQASVRAAEDIGAPQVPRAAYHLKLAEDQLAEAKRLMKLGEYSRAETLMARATADAELAVALTKEVIARSEAQLVKDEVASLRNSSR